LSLPTTFDFYSNALGAETIARVAKGVELSEIEAVLLDRYVEKREQWEADGYSLRALRLIPIRDRLVRDVRQPLLVLVGAAPLVLLLGCLNLAGVCVSQIVQRNEEFGMRRALGASRVRIFAILLSETVALSLLGGVMVLFASWLGTAALRAYLPAELPGVSSIGLDPITMLFAFAVTTVVGIAFGGLAAVRGARVDALVWGRRGTPGRSTRRLQTMLAVAQGALALVLVVGAMLTVRRFQRLQGHGLGFDPDHTLVMRMRIPHTEDTFRDDVTEYSRAVRARIAEVPGVRSVGIVNSLPLHMELGHIQTLRLPGTSEDDALSAENRLATAQYFAAAGIDLIAGRSFDDDPGASDGHVIIDRELAAQFFPSGGAVGQTLELRDFADGGWLWTPVTIRGVVERVRSRGARSDDFPSMYRSFDTYPLSNLGVAVQTAGDPREWLEQAREAARSVDSNIIPFGVAPMRSVARDVIGTDRALATVISGFSLAALLLVGLGLYGLIGQQVTLRRREYGVRLALGARPERLVGSMTRHGALIGAATLLLGVPAAGFAARSLEARLFEVDAGDPLSLLVGGLGLMALSIVAAWLPARGVMRVHPRECLTAE